MGDDWYSGLRALRQEKHAGWKEKNLAALRASGIPFSERPEACLFREPGRPRVDFYPSTGRWRVVGGGRTFRGGAVAFLAWYRKQAEGGADDAEVTHERHQRRRQHEATDVLLHPGGRCTCGGEGRCEWCARLPAGAERPEDGCVCGGDGVCQHCIIEEALNHDPDWSGVNDG